MKKIILPSFVIAITLWMWQFVSFAAANLHSGGQQYTPYQDTIASFIGKLNLADGEYLIPQVDPKKPDMKMEDWNQYYGKPWMFLKYYNNREDVMGMNMIRGFSSNWVAGFIIIYLLNLMGSMKLIKSILTTLGMGFVVFIYVPYTNHIWFPDFDTLITLLDCLAPFALIGVWNGLFWNKQ